MRFDFLLAVISSGLYAPLALMACGFLLAVGGAIFLWQRRKKGPKPDHIRKPADDETAQTTPETIANSETIQASAEPEAAEYAPVTGKADTAASKEDVPARSEGGRRRRQLVGVAERDEGTPSGETSDLDTQPLEPKVEEAEFVEYDQTSPEEIGPEETAPTEIAPAETALNDEFAGELDPEWIEDEPESGSEAFASTAALAATGAVAGGASLAMADAASEEKEEEALDSDQPEETLDAVPEPAAQVEVQAPEISTPNVPAQVAAALSRPIVFRQFMPQSPGKDGLSFFGGEPIGPADFQWPRERGAEGGAPLQFIMQWDCSQLSQADTTGLIPQDGVLYCFVNCDRDDSEDFLASHVFMQLKGSVQGWGPVPVPDDAGPALGQLGAYALSGCTGSIESAADFVPRVLPRFPFAPVAFEYPADNQSGTDQPAMFWSDETAAAFLHDIQKSGVAMTTGTATIGHAHEDLGRPFPSFPHDFGAVRVLASRMIEALEHPEEVMAETLYQALSPDERAAQFAAWTGEAREIYLLGTQRPQSQRLEQNISDDVWQWFEERKGVMGAAIPAMVEEAIDLSLGVGSEALGTVPAHWIDKAMHAHALATEHAEHDNETGVVEEPRIYARTPARMFGPSTMSEASMNQDAAGHFANDHILLLELPSGAGPQHHFGGSVLQYWITADDLAAGKFDAVKMEVVGP